MPITDKKKTKEESGQRLSAWVPEKDLWLFTMLRNEATKEREKGNEGVTMGKIIVRILKEHYEKQLDSHER